MNFRDKAISFLKAFYNRNSNPQYDNVGNLGDILKHSALINLLKLLARHNRRGFAYIETHAFLLNAPCPKPVQWARKVCRELSLYQAYKDYMDAERPIMDGGNYRCSVGLAIDTLKETIFNKPYLVLVENNHETRSILKDQLLREGQKNCTVLKDAFYLNRAIVPKNVDTLFMLVDPLEFDDTLWERITGFIENWTSAHPSTKVVLELFIFDGKETVDYPSPPDGILGPVSFIHRQPYNLAVYSTADIAENVARCCSLLGWKKSEN